MYVRHFGSDWFRQWLVASLEPCRYRNQFKKYQIDIFTSKSFHSRNSFEIVVCKRWPICLGLRSLMPFDCPAVVSSVHTLPLESDHLGSLLLAGRETYLVQIGTVARKIGKPLFHYSAIIMTAIASQITILTVVYSNVYLGADQRKHQSPASLAFVGDYTCNR